MIETFLDLILPNHCCICGELGAALCNNCKNYITNDHTNHCLKCGLIITDHCPTCRLPYSKSWQLGFRQDELETLINQYKLRPRRSLARPLAELLASTLPILPEETFVVPIPTIPSHIRQRGFGHIELVARHLARLSSSTYAPILHRLTDTVQHGNSRAKRLAQAKQAFACHDQLSPTANYLIIDDVYTTGATINASTHLLHQSGARHIWVALLSRQKNK